MRLTGVPRVLTIVVLSALPPLLAWIAVDAWTAGWALGGRTTAQLLVVGFVIAWVAVMSVAGDRIFGAEATSIIALAERGEAESGTGARIERIAEVLERRDVQLQRLAAETAAAPIVAGPQAVAAHIVRTARRVTSDSTWTLAILVERAELPGGVYDEVEVATTSELHRWAATSAPDAANAPAVIVGPWGAFLVARLASTQEVRAILVAPWEGRPDPSAADRTILTLLAEQAGTALDHALLYSQAQRQSAELNRLAGVQQAFVRGITHDLQSPLAAINAMAADLRQRAAPDDEGDLAVIEHQAQRLSRMVGQLLTMSAMEAGTVSPRRDVFRVELVLSRVTAAMARADRQFVITNSGADRLVVGDPDRLEQALWAVLDNAVKYSPPESPVEIARALVTTETGVFEEIAVTDAGIGMDAVTAARAFEQFFRSERARDVAPNGSGIGLFTARGLMSLMGGSIGLASELGRGCTVRLRLPAELVDAADA